MPDNKLEAKADEVATSGGNSYCSPIDLPDVVMKLMVSNLNYTELAIAIRVNQSWKLLIKPPDQPKNEPLKVFRKTLMPLLDFYPEFAKELTSEEAVPRPVPSAEERKEEKTKDQVTLEVVNQIILQQFPFKVLNEFLPNTTRGLFCYLYSKKNCELLQKLNLNNFVLRPEGIDLSGINLSGVKRLKGFCSSGAKLNGANLQLTNIEGGNLGGQGSELQGAQLQGMKAKRIQLCRSNMTAVQVDAETDLQYADLTQATLNNADLSKAKLIGAKLYNIVVNARTLLPHAYQAVMDGGSVEVINHLEHAYNETLHNLFNDIPVDAAFELILNKLGAYAKTEPKKIELLVCHHADKPEIRQLYEILKEEMHFHESTQDLINKERALIPVSSDPEEKHAGPTEEERRRAAAIASWYGHKEASRPAPGSSHSSSSSSASGSAAAPIDPVPVINDLDKAEKDVLLTALRSYKRYREPKEEYLSRTLCFCSLFAIAKTHKIGAVNELIAALEGGPKARLTKEEYNALWQWNSTLRGIAKSHEALIVKYCHPDLVPAPQDPRVR